jgi:long-chain acyl-CoA synthetase
MPARVLGDDEPVRVLDALDDDEGGPVAVVDHRRRRRDDLLPRLRHAAPGTWLVAFTSGSTSTPRGVCRTRASWDASADSLAQLTGTSAGTRVLVPGPLSSTLFLHAAWHARQARARPVLGPLDTTEPWDVVHLVPAQLRALLDGCADLDRRTAVVAGAALDPATAAVAQRRGLRVVTYYGAAELSFVAIDVGEGLRAFPGAEVASRDGVLWVRSPFVADGYLPESSVDAAEGGAMRGDAGWATVGDRGAVRDDGVISVRGRGEDAVQTGGATVWVADVEHTLRGAPGVRDVVVLGLAHPRLGHVVAAAVESDDEPSALSAWARTRLDPAALPRRWAVVAALQRTPAGKVDRAAAGALFQREGAGD